ncbi:hypothetical protein ACFYXS_15005 [Streptomyces sp. NPDC002574]|uniref:hypothetical protein n=1 Tax=Streptomyces sp. NPDC002574 TaxID=3364652 RepID=UPI0036CE6397
MSLMNRKNVTSLKGKVLAAAATVTIVGGLGTAGTLSANAATPECGDSCIQIYSATFGTSERPNLVETVYRGVARAGQPTAMHPVSTSDPAGDIVGHRAGQVSDFYKDGLVSAEVNKHYGTLRAVEVEYAPHGKRTCLCAGLAHTAYQDEGLTLQKCDTPGRTVWIIDTADSPATAPQGHFPLVSGATTNFAHPYAMTVTRGGHQHHGHGHGHAHHGHRTAVPLQIRVTRLMGNPSHVPAGQLWGTTK